MAQKKTTNQNKVKNNSNYKPPKNDLRSKQYFDESTIQIPKLKSDLKIEHKKNNENSKKKNTTTISKNTNKAKKTNNTKAIPTSSHKKSNNTNKNKSTKSANKNEIPKKKTENKNLVNNNSKNNKNNLSSKTKSKKIDEKGDKQNKEGNLIDLKQNKNINNKAPKEKTNIKDTAKQQKKDNYNNEKAKKIDEEIDNFNKEEEQLNLKQNENINDSDLKTKTNIEDITNYENQKSDNYSNEKAKEFDDEIDNFNKEEEQLNLKQNENINDKELKTKKKVEDITNYENQKSDNYNNEKAKEIDTFNKEEEQIDLKQNDNINDKELKAKTNIEDTTKFDTTLIDNQKLNVNDLKRELEIIYGEKKIEEPKTKIVKKKRLRPWVFYLLIIIFSSILVFSSYQIYKWHKDNQNIKELKKDIDTDIKPKENNEQGELVNPPDDKNSDYWYYINLPFYEVDFSELKKKNSDTVAFIHMNNTNINYPVVQTSNNDYYLTHAFDKSKNNAGWVFMDYRNTLSPLSDNVVIYGHGRVNKTVFGSLKDTLSKSWQKNKDNFVIWLSTPNENLLYQIFSIYTIQSESYYISTDFATDTDKQNWLNTMKQRNTASIDTPVDVSDNIITLSTCQNNNGGRIVVQAKLIKRQTR